MFDDGTKVRENALEFFEPEYPESMDIKITNSCDMMCPFCHEASTPDGKRGDILNLPFLDSLLPYTELAIGGGNPLSHPDLLPFLQGLKDRKLIANMTVNQAHFLKNVPLLQDLTERGLLYGLGISFVSGTPLDQIKNLVNQVEMEEELGRERCQRSDVPEGMPRNYRNGYSKKNEKTQLGESTPGSKRFIRAKVGWSAPSGSPKAPVCISRTPRTAAQY